MERRQMSDSSDPVFSSCLTIAIVIGLFLGLLFLIWAGISIYSTFMLG